jgi:protein SCO1/2
MLAAISGFYTFQKEMARPKLPVLGQVQSFELTDQNGNVFPSSSLNRQVWVANFFFTTCSDICPMITKNMAALSRSFEQVPAVKLVSITVNPENDSPDALKKYSEKFEGKKNNWVFLTGDRDKITKLTLESFKVGSVDEPIFHSAKLVLVDSHGLIRGYYEGTQKEDIEKLFKDIAGVLKER